MRYEHDFWYTYSITVFFISMISLWPQDLLNPVSTVVHFLNDDQTTQKEDSVQGNEVQGDTYSNNTQGTYLTLETISILPLRYQER